MVLVLVAVLAFGLTGTSAAPAVVPSGHAVVDSNGGAASSGAPGRKRLGGPEDAVADDEPVQLVGSSAFTHLAE